MKILSIITFCFLSIGSALAGTIQINDTIRITLSSKAVQPLNENSYHYDPVEKVIYMAYILDAFSGRERDYNGFYVTIEQGENISPSGRNINYSSYYGAYEIYFLGADIKFVDSQTSETLFEFRVSDIEMIPCLLDSENEIVETVTLDQATNYFPVGKYGDFDISPFSYGMKIIKDGDTIVEECISSSTTYINVSVNDVDFSWSENRDSIPELTINDSIAIGGDTILYLCPNFLLASEHRSRHFGYLKITDNPVLDISEIKGQKSSFQTFDLSGREGEFYENWEDFVQSEERGLYIIKYESGESEKVFLDAN